MHKQNDLFNKKSKELTRFFLIALNTLYSFGLTDTGPASDDITRAAADRDARLSAAAERCGATRRSFTRSSRPRVHRANTAETWQRGAEESGENRRTRGETKVSGEHVYKFCAHSFNYYSTLL